MDFISWLGSLFGGGQQAAPSAPVPGPVQPEQPINWASYVESPQGMNDYLGNQLAIDAGMRLPANQISPRQLKQQASPNQLEKPLGMRQYQGNQLALDMGLQLDPSILGKNQLAQNSSANRLEAPLGMRQWQGEQLKKKAYENALAQMLASIGGN